MRKIRTLPLIDLPRLDLRTFIELDRPLIKVDKFISNGAWIFLRDRATKAIENRITFWSKQDSISNRSLSALGGMNWIIDADTENRELFTYFGRSSDDGSLIMLKSSMREGIFQWCYWGYLKKLLPKASFCLAKTRSSPSLFLEGNKIVGALMEIHCTEEEKDEDIPWTLARKYING